MSYPHIGGVRRQPLADNELRKFDFREGQIAHRARVFSPRSSWSKAGWVGRYVAKFGCSRKSCNGGAEVISHTLSRSRRAVPRSARDRRGTGGAREHAQWPKCPQGFNYPVSASKQTRTVTLARPLLLRPVMLLNAYRAAAVARLPPSRRRGSRRARSDSRREGRRLGGLARRPPSPRATAVPAPAPSGRVHAAWTPRRRRAVQPLDRPAARRARAADMTSCPRGALFARRPPGVACRWMMTTGPRGAGAWARRAVPRPAGRRHQAGRAPRGTAV